MASASLSLALVFAVLVRARVCTTVRIFRPLQFKTARISRIFRLLELRNFPGFSGYISSKLLEFPGFSGHISSNPARISRIFRPCQLKTARISRIVRPLELKAARISRIFRPLEFKTARISRIFRPLEFKTAQLILLWDGCATIDKSAQAGADRQAWDVWSSAQRRQTVTVKWTFPSDQQNCNCNGNEFPSGPKTVTVTT